MTNSGVKDLYLWLSTAWPLVVKPGADEEWQRATKQNLYRTYRDYSDEEVFAAFQKWTEENEKFPTTKNVINEIQWARRRTLVPKKQAERYFMECIRKDGTEFCYSYNGHGSMTWDEFINHPRNINHLDPIEWERRFRITRRETLKKLCSRPLTYEEQRWKDSFMEHVRSGMEYRRQHDMELHSQEANL